MNTAHLKPAQSAKQLSQLIAQVKVSQVHCWCCCSITLEAFKPCGYVQNDEWIYAFQLNLLQSG
jgi:hypothetical protein